MASRVEYLKRFIYLSMCVFSCLEAARSMNILVNGGHQNLTLTLKEKFEVHFYFVDGLKDAQNITVYVQHRLPGSTVFNSKCILKYSRENCTSTTTLCRCMGPPLANYSLSKVFTQEDAGTWVVTLWKAQNQVKETIDIFVEENTSESSLSAAVISIVSFIIVSAVVSLSFLIFWCWSRFFVKTVLLIVMASTDTPSDVFHRESTFMLKKSRNIYNISSKTLSEAATTLNNLATTCKPATALLEPAIALPGPATKLPEPEVALPESALSFPAQALLQPPTTLPGSSNALPATAFPETVVPLSLSALTTQLSPPAKAQPRKHPALPPPPAPSPTTALPPQAQAKVPPPTPPKPPLATASEEWATAPQSPLLPSPALSPQALSKVPPPTPPKPPLQESASAPPSPPPPTTALLPQGLPKLPPPTPPKPPLATASKELASTPQPPLLPTPQPSPALVSASTSVSIIKPSFKITFSM